MRFKSTSSDISPVSFRDAVLDCLPGDGGLYVPDTAMDLRQFFLYMDEDISFPEMAASVVPCLFESELNPVSASRVAQSAFDFEPELIRLDDDFSILNLHNGPTGVYKDFGIAFLAASMEEMIKDSGQHMVFSAVRGDTGVSIARAFSGRKDITAVLVYPSGPVRGLNQDDFITNGGNIIPIQIRGSFDDCQRLVSETILDRDFSSRYNITSANAINPGRLLPQVFYYLYAFIKMKKELSGDLAFSVPCGNFGNLIAGLYAWKFGMPVNGFIAAMNSNNTLGDFLKGCPFVRRQAISTNSPALDVSVPSNLKRLESFYREAPSVMRNMVFPVSVDDTQTLQAIEYAWKKYSIYLNPHSAVAFAAAKTIADKGNCKSYGHTVILATGHYARTSVVTGKATGQDIPVPESFRLLNREIDPIAVISPRIEAFEGIVAGCF